MCVASTTLIIIIIIRVKVLHIFGGQKKRNGLPNHKHTHTHTHRGRKRERGGEREREREGESERENKQNSSYTRAIFRVIHDIVVKILKIGIPKIITIINITVQMEWQTV